MLADHRRIDIVGIQPSATSIVEGIARVFIDHLGASLVTLVAHGSAVKGGIVPGSSDVDAIAFVRPERLTAHGELPLDTALDLHRDLARIDPAPFRYLQAYVQPAGTMHGLGFIPGTFHIVTGAPDVPTATGEELLAAARHALGELDPDAARARISHALLNHGEGRLDRQVRWTCTDVWPLMYHVACVHLDDGPERVAPEVTPLVLPRVGDSGVHGATQQAQLPHAAVAAWQRTKHEVLAILADDPIVGDPLAHWFEVVTDHYANGETLESALAALSAAGAFYDAAAQWFARRG